MAVLGAFTALLVLAGSLLWLLGGPAAITTAENIGGPFRLITADGRTVTDQTFRGQYMLIYFGYTSCPDTCPTTLANITNALGHLGSRGKRIQPLFITVDPQRDTPAVLAKYLSAFTPRLIGLTGSAGEIAKVEREFHVSAAAVHTGGSKSDYSVDHSAALYLIGPDGSFVAALPVDSGGDALATSIAQYFDNAAGG